MHALDAQLVALAPQLAQLAVALRTTVLPALPLLAPEVAGKLQVGSGRPRSPRRL
jgi:hypothetical protein